MADASGAAPGALKNAEQAAKLINDLQDISFLKLAMIFIVTWLLIALAKRVLPYLAERGPNQVRLYILGAVPIIRLVLLLVAISWSVPIVFNITLQNFFVIAGALSVAIGFAFKDYVSSLIAGIVAIFERPYRPGDWVRIGEDYGEVRGVGMRALQVQTPADDTVTVPHDKLWKENIVNSNNGARTLMCIANFYLEPDHEADRVRSALYDVALTSAYLEYDKPILIMLADTPFGTHYKVKAYPFDMRDQFNFISDLTVRGKQAVAQAGGRSVSAPAADQVMD